MNRPRWQLALPALLLVWAVAILPSALPRPWAILDDWRLWDMATSHGWVDMLFSRNDGERYRPVFWLYYAAIAHGLGPSRTAHHLVQALVLALCGGGYMLLTAQQARVQSWLAWSLPALLFVQSPLAENAYTLAKADWMTALGLLGTLAFGLLALTQPVRWPWWLLAASVCAGGAVLVKESGLVAIGTVALLGLAGYAAQSWRGRGLLIWQAAAVLLFAGTYWLPSRYLIQPTTYRLTLADLSLRSMAFNGYIYLTKYPELFMLGGGALAGLWFDRQRLSRRHPVGLLAGVAFLSGLASLGLLIVWKWPCGYFLMPVVACWLTALLLTADAWCRCPGRGGRWSSGWGCCGWRSMWWALPRRPGCNGPAGTAVVCSLKPMSAKARLVPACFFPNRCPKLKFPLRLTIRSSGAATNGSAHSPAPVLSRSETTPKTPTCAFRPPAITLPCATMRGPSASMCACLRTAQPTDCCRAWKRWAGSSHGSGHITSRCPTSCPGATWGAPYAWNMISTGSMRRRRYILPSTAVGGVRMTGPGHG